MSLIKHNIHDDLFQEMAGSDLEVEEPDETVVYACVSSTLDNISESMTCLECGLTFEEGDNYTQHMSTHCKHFSCTVCGLLFKLKSNLKNHEKVHKETTLFSCNICCKNFL